jgi:hypothetical protein
MESKIFSYKVDDVYLEPADNNLKISKAFDKKAIIVRLKEVLKDENFKLDERSLDYKIVDGQLFIEGVIIKNEAPKSIGFMSGK